MPIWFACPSRFAVGRGSNALTSCVNDWPLRQSGYCNA
jgi:hypothetical protein